MSFLVDANLLVYAAMPSAAEHAPSRQWLERAFDDDDQVVGLAWSTLYAFVRLVSNRRVVANRAVPVREAWSAAEGYRQQRNAVIVEPGAGHASIAGDLFQTPGLSADDVPDVHLAALAIERGLVLATHDHGFARFHNLRWIDPLR